jgi:pimeloyl-ACP methyl ester carboxylesterase
MTDLCFMTPSHEKYKVAYVQTPAHPVHDKKCHVVFLTGFRSDMQGTKAVFLEDWAKKTGRGFVRFDYGGHGQSEGVFEELCVSDWLEDATSVLKTLLKDKPVIVIGSSMGGWIGLLLARALPDQVEGFIGLASAPDMTGALMWDTFDPETQEQLMKEGKIFQDCDYDSENPYVITRHLIEDGQQYLFLDQEELNLDLPVRLIHGMKDQDVPWTLSVHLSQIITSEDIQLHLIKGGDHRLSAPQDFQILEDVLTRLVNEIDEVNETSDALIKEQSQP